MQQILSRKLFFEDIFFNGIKSTGVQITKIQPNSVGWANALKPFMDGT